MFTKENHPYTEMYSTSSSTVTLLYCMGLGQLTQLSLCFIAGLFETPVISDALKEEILVTYPGGSVCFSFLFFKAVRGELDIRVKTTQPHKYL